jgi:hypothetical protein
MVEAHRFHDNRQKKVVDCQPQPAQSFSACRRVHFTLVFLPFRLYHIPHYLTNNKNLGESNIEQEACALIFSGTLCEAFLILRIVQRDIALNVLRCLCQVPVFLVRF